MWSSIRNCAAHPKFHNPMGFSKRNTIQGEKGSPWKKRCGFKGDLTSHDVKGWKADNNTSSMILGCFKRWFPDETWGYCEEPRRGPMLFGQSHVCHMSSVALACWIRSDKIHHPRDLVQCQGKVLGNCAVVGQPTATCWFTHFSSCIGGEEVRESPGMSWALPGMWMFGDGMKINGDTGAIPSHTYGKDGKGRNRVVWVQLRKILLFRSTRIQSEWSHNLHKMESSMHWWPWYFNLLAEQFHDQKLLTINVNLPKWVVFTCLREMCSVSFLKLPSFGPHFGPHLSSYSFIYFVSPHIFRWSIAFVLCLHSPWWITTCLIVLLLPSPLVHHFPTISTIFQP